MTNVDGLGLSLAGVERDRIAMKRGSNAGLRGGLVACPFAGQGLDHEQGQ